MKYIALTIGPIVDTLTLGRKTSEVWMASYLFSSFMKKVIKKIKEGSDVHFIIPYTGDDAIFKPKDNGIGMFHDRFILQSDTLDIESIEILLQSEKDTLAVMIAQSIGRDEGKVKTFIDQYLQTYLFETEETFSNPIIDISSILDSIELHIPTLESDEDYMRLFLNRNTILKSQLAIESFGKKPSFDAIDVIADQELDNDIEAANAYKYIAIIYADGDNLGKYIEHQSNATAVSKNLFNFGRKASETITDFGALPIFIGGDDLIMFSPLLNKGKTVFDLLDTLSSDYKDALGTEESTVSFGVSITYYKYPLYEALTRARETLLDVAKKYEGKNAVATSIQKHSGQSFEFCIGKKEEAYMEFSKLIKSVLAEDIELPHAIHHKLESYKKVFEAINEEKIVSTFENIFNEDMHQEKFKQGLYEIGNLMKALGVDEKAQDKLFSMLSTIKVLRGDR